MNIIQKRLDQGVEIYVTQYVFIILYCYILTTFMLLFYSNAMLCCICHLEIQVKSTLYPCCVGKVLIHLQSPEIIN